MTNCNLERSQTRIQTLGRRFRSRTRPRTPNNSGLHHKAFLSDPLSDYLQFFCSNDIKKKLLFPQNASLCRNPRRQSAVIHRPHCQTLPKGFSSSTQYMGSGGALTFMFCGTRYSGVQMGASTLGHFTFLILTMPSRGTAVRERWNLFKGGPVLSGNSLLGAILSCWERRDA